MEMALLCLVQVLMHPLQGVWNRREIQLTWPALPHAYACFADGCSIFIRNIQNRLLYLRYLYIRQIFLIQSMYKHLVGRAASFISSFYFLLLDLLPVPSNCHYDAYLNLNQWNIKCFWRKIVLVWLPS